MRWFRHLHNWFLVILGFLISITTSPALSTGDDFIVRDKSTEGISYITGGIGIEERAAMKNQVGNYNLWLEFDISAGNFLSEVEVMIKDTDGNMVLYKKSKGPWFMTSLPPGKYNVRSTARNKTILIEVEVPSDKKITLTWP